MKLIFFFLFILSNAFSQSNEVTLSQRQKWETSVFQVRTQNETLCATEIQFSDQIPNTQVLNQILESLYNAEGSIEVNHLQTNNIQIYHLQHLDYDDLRKLINNFTSGFEIKDKKIFTMDEVNQLYIEKH